MYVCPNCGSEFDTQDHFMQAAPCSVVAVNIIEKHKLELSLIINGQREAK